MSYGDTNLTFVTTLTALLFCSLHVHSQTTSIAAPIAYDYERQSD
jgi:hypothetical protein